MTHPLEAGLRSWLERAAIFASVEPRKCTSIRLAAVLTPSGETTFVLELTNTSGTTRRLEVTHDHPVPLHSVRAAASALRLVDDDQPRVLHEPGTPIATTTRRTR